MVVAHELAGPCGPSQGRAGTRVTPPWPIQEACWCWGRSSGSGVEDTSLWGTVRNPLQSTGGHSERPREAMCHPSGARLAGSQDSVMGGPGT